MLAKFDGNELEVWSTLYHPNIVQLYGATREGDVIYIFQEFIHGKCRKLSFYFLDEFKSLYVYAKYRWRVFS